MSIDTTKFFKQIVSSIQILLDIVSFKVFKHRMPFILEWTCSSHASVKCLETLTSFYLYMFAPSPPPLKKTEEETKIRLGSLCEISDTLINIKYGGGFSKFHFG